MFVLILIAFLPGRPVFREGDFGPVVKHYHSVKPLKQAVYAPQARVDVVVAAPILAVSVPVVANSAPSNCGDNSYANYIYTHESGCSTTILNSIGCLGIGQACPASKLLAVCPNEDYACENIWFTDYANRTYGGWLGAYNFWLANHWW